MELRFSAELRNQDWERRLQNTASLPVGWNGGMDHRLFWETISQFVNRWSVASATWRRRRGDCIVRTGMGRKSAAIGVCSEKCREIPVAARAGPRGRDDQARTV